jgi:hypothetical protein
VVGWTGVVAVVSVKVDGPGGGGGMLLSTADADVKPGAGSDMLMKRRAE